MGERKRVWMGCGVLVLGILFVLIGVMRDEVATVFLKATSICLECIGIG